MKPSSATGSTTKYRLVRLDFWDYRHPTELVFDTYKEAAEKADFLERKSYDPLSCYLVETESV